MRHGALSPKMALEARRLTENGRRRKREGRRRLRFDGAEKLVPEFVARLDFSLNQEEPRMWDVAVGAGRAHTEFMPDVSNLIVLIEVKGKIRMPFHHEPLPNCLHQNIWSWIFEGAKNN